MKLTTDFLKQESCSFDLECVYVLDLSKKGIKDLDHIKECTNIEILNLSLNDINDLIQLKELVKLQYLNLSFNNIKHLDGLEGLENLKSLNLAGNNIDIIDEFYKLKNLENLTHIILNDPKSSATNPLCNKNKNYKTELKKLLPHLELIDGESFKLNTKNLFKLFDESINQIKNSNNDFELKNSSESWFKNILIDKNDDLKFHNLLDEDREKFKNTYDEIERSIELKYQTVSRIEAGLKSINSK